MPFKMTILAEVLAPAGRALALRSTIPAGLFLLFLNQTKAEISTKGISLLMFVV